MGLMGYGIQDLNVNLENSGISENLVQNLNSEAPTPGNCNLDSEKVAIETVERKEVREVKNIDTKLVSMPESSYGLNDIGQKPGEISENFDAKGVTPFLENSEGPMLSQLIDFDDMDLPPGFSFLKPDDNGKLEPTPKDVNNDPGYFEDANKGTPAQARKRKTKLKGPVTSSWVLRTKSQEKPQVPVLNDTVKEGSTNGEKKSRGRKKKQIKENTVDEFPRTKTHLRYLLHRIKYEQNLIDAYSAEGWKGQSLEKLKPEKELERAKSHISSYKLKIRALVQQLDSSLAVGKLPASLFDSKGEIDSEDIFCAKCGSKDLTLDNDIILCDGACERGFHQFCLEPPLLKEHIPQGDEAWLCPGCDCKARCIDMLKDFHGTNISMTDSWEKIFPEAAAAASGKKLEDNSVSSSEDSEDDDFDPEKPDTVDRIEGDKSCSEESNYVSASEDALTFTNNDGAPLPPDDSDEEDDDFDPTAADPDEQAKQDTSSSDFTSDSEDLDGLLGDSAEPGKDPEQNSSQLPDEMQGKSVKNELSCLMEASEEPVSGKRHVERLDYKKLHDETYGDYSSGSSDEDFGAKRRKVSREKSKVKSTHKTPSANYELDTKDESQLAKNSSATFGSASADTKSRSAWIGEDAKKKLYEYFNENQYPDKAAKEKLANELGLTMIQVTRWFGHARWTFNHKSKPKPNTIEKPPEPGPTNGTGGQVPQMQESVENSGKRNNRKRKPRKDQTMNNVTVTQNTQEQNPLI